MDKINISKQKNTPHIQTKMKVKTNFRKMYLIDETMMNSKLSYQNMSLRPQSEATSSIHINHPPVSADSTLHKVPPNKGQESSELGKGFIFRIGAEFNLTRQSGPVRTPFFSMNAE